MSNESSYTNVVFTDFMFTDSQISFTTGQITFILGEHGKFCGCQDCLNRKLKHRVAALESALKRVIFHATCIDPFGASDAK